MAINYPGPYELRFNYNVSNRDHQFRHSLDFVVDPVAGQDVNTISYAMNGGGEQSLVTWIDDTWEKVAKLFNDVDLTVGVVELFRYTPLSFSSDYITSYLPTGIVGSNNATEAANQMTITLRSLEGGYAKIVLLDTIVLHNNQSKQFPTGTAALDNVATHLTKAGTAMLARDTSYVFQPLRYSTGQNEAVWRKIYRDN